MKKITLYRDDFKAPQDGVPKGWTFFDDVLVQLGVKEEETKEFNEVDIRVDDYLPIPK